MSDAAEEAPILVDGSVDIWSGLTPQEITDINKRRTLEDAFCEIALSPQETAGKYLAVALYPSGIPYQVAIDHDEQALKKECFARGLRKEDFLIREIPDFSMWVRRRAAVKDVLDKGEPGAAR